MCYGSNTEPNLMHIECIMASFFIFNTQDTSSPTYTKALMKDGDFKDAQSAMLNSKPVWWVDTTATGSVANTRQKTDIQLYTRGDATLVGTFTDNSTVAITAGQPFVECASCHDPHSSNPTFLRILNTGSAVLLTLNCSTA